tara:strand:+ start:2213 stop:3403 length:1191 start_codon:yes stop_codon:yes gene_type:complete
MAAFTSIAAATVAVGGSAAKGFLAGDAAKDAAREAGRLEIEQEQLQQESIAKLEQNFLDAVRATTDIYDKQLQLSNVQGSQLVEAAQEGDQRGVAATAGKVKQVQDVATGQIADKMALQKLDIDMKRAAADEMDAARVAALMDDRAAAAGLKAEAKRNESEALSAASTGAFIDAGVSALTAGISAFGGAEGRAAQELVDSGQAADLTAAQGMLDAGNFSNADFRKIARGKFDVVNTGKMFSPEDFTKFGKIGVEGPLAEGEFSDLDFDAIAQMTPEQYDTFYGSLTSTQKGMIDGLQDNRQIFVDQSRSKFGDALFNVKNIATDLLNVKKNANAPATTPAQNAIVDQAATNPLAIMQYLYPNMTENEIIGGGFGTPDQYRDYFNKNIFGGMFLNRN